MNKATLLWMVLSLDNILEQSYEIFCDAAK